jgi:copper chaperone
LYPSRFLLSNRITSVYPSMAEQTHKFNVKMTCTGCSGAVTRVLSKAQNEGVVSSFDVNLDTQEVLVKGTIPYNDVLAKIQKTGKEVRSGETIA